MRVLIVSNMYPTKKSPAFGTFVKNFADGLAQRRPGYRIDIVAVRGTTSSKWGKLCKYVGFYASLLCKLLFKKYDIVYVHTITFPTPPLRIASLFRDLNLMFNVHGVDVLTRTRLAARLKQLCRPLVLKSHYIVVPSDYFKRVVAKEFLELDRQKIIVSASGGVSRAFFCQERQPSSSSIRIGYVSRIVQGKGWDTLLKALKMLDDKDVDFEATIVGAGAESVKLTETLARNGFRNRVKYVGAIGHDRLPDFYKSIDLFIFPSENESESLGLVGLEAMATSVPVIGSDIGGIATYVEDGVNGFLFRPRDHEELAERILRYMRMTEPERLGMMRAAYATATRYESSLVLDTLFDKIFPEK